MIKIDISQLYFVLDHTPADQNVMLVGGHGIGKSEILTSYYQAKGINVVPLFLGQMSDPGDIIGLPYRSQETGRTEFMPPYWFPVEGRPVVLFLDELNRARPEVLQTIMDLTLNRTLAGRSLPEGSMVIAAVNFGEEYMLTEMDPALVSRFNVYEFKPSVREWLKWAKSAGMDSRILRFIESEPVWLDGDAKQYDNTGSIIEKTPDRRAWERVSDILSGFDKVDSRVLKLLSGVVGEKAGKAFAAFLARPVGVKMPYTASEVLCNYEAFDAELKRASVHVLTSLNSDIFHYLSDNPAPSASAGLKKYIAMLSDEGKVEAIADFVNQFSDKRNSKAVSFIGRECYEAVLVMQEYIAKL